MTSTADSFVGGTALDAPLTGDVQYSPAVETVGTGQLAAAVRSRILGALANRSARERPLAMVVAATVLWTRFHKHDAADPRWPDRDRIVFCGTRAPLLHAVLLNLSGHDGAGAEALRRFHEPETAAPGLTQASAHPAIEMTGGPSGQGVAHAVGLALAERLLAARFGRSLVDHRTWVVASDGDLVSGLSHEAASLAGYLRLGRLTVLWDESAAAEGDLEAASASEDALRRFAGYGWTVRRVDGQAPHEVAASLAMAVRSRKPSLIACRLQRSDDTVHDDAPLPPDTDPEILAAWAAAGTRGTAPRRAWLKRLARHALRSEFERVMASRLPDAMHEALTALRTSFAASRPAMATRAASQSVLEAVVPSLPELVGGSADLTVPATSHFATHLGASRHTAGRTEAARLVPWAMREHGMAAAMNGLALHGGVIPYGGTFVVFSDYMRPALRLAALMRQRVIHVLTRDGGDRAEENGDDGPAHQAIEQLASLRAVPNLFVFRPADAIETAECWELALCRDDGPSLLALSRQPVPSLRPPGAAGENRAARGGYVLAEAEGGRHATVIASGPEVATAMAARELLRGEGIRVAVISLPCWELFDRLDAAEQDAVLGAAPRIGVEAAGDFGWARWLGPSGRFVGFRGPGADARVLAWSAQARPTSADVVAAVRQSLPPTD